MEEKLNFSLPEKKPRASAVQVLSLVLLVALAIVASANLFVALSGGASAPEAKGAGPAAEETRQLAAKLAQRNLYRQAAGVWQEYLASAALADAERAKALFQVGALMEKAGQYGEAVEYYYRSEAAAKLDELEPQINAHIKDCFERLGKFSALRYELMERTSLKQSAGAGGRVVAEIGAEKITEADLSALIEEGIDNQLVPMAAFMTAEQLNEQKKKMLERYKDSQARQQYLQSWLAQEILYRQALAEQLGEKAEVKKLLGELMRGVLSQQLMNTQLASKINITETDLQTYYGANKEQYIEPAKAGISHILVGDEQQARDLIKRIKEGEDFAGLAKEFSQDQSTKESGGKIDVDVTEGSYVAGVGDANEVNAGIFAAEPPVVLDEPFKTEKGWEIIRVDEKRAERQKGFDEVRQQVMMTLTNLKRQEVQQDYIEQMMEKYNVIIHTSVLNPPDKVGSEQGDSGRGK
jgi:foldase protein PrsA